MKESEKASENLKNFIKIIKKLFVEERVKFDLIIGAGDSGIAMVKITELILNEINISPPKNIVLPFFRFTEKHAPRGEAFDNLSLRSNLKDTVAGQKFNKILFVDDEINKARTLNGVIELIRKADSNVLSTDTNLYILAENRGFSPDFIPGLKIKFMPFGEKVEGFNNVIFEIIPFDLRNKLEREYGEFYSAELVCVLLDLPIKELRGGKPYWSKNLLNDVKSKVQNLESYQKEFEDFLRNFIKENL